MLHRTNVALQCHLSVYGEVDNKPLRLSDFHGFIFIFFLLGTLLNRDFTKTHFSVQSHTAHRTWRVLITKYFHFSPSQDTLVLCKV